MHTTTWTPEDELAPTWVPEDPALAGFVASAPVARPAYGQDLVAGRYRTVRRLGSGGCGDVFLAVDETILGRRVALKRLPPYLRGGSSAERFAKEARMAVRVRHPNIVTVYDFDHDDDGSPFLVMEHVAGVTLVEHARESLPLYEIAEIGLQICEALAALHTDGVIHRDIKPANIMVGNKKGRLSVKLVDFGLAKLVCEPTPLPTATDAICGTPQYMSPEQILGAAVDARTDVFALGCVLYELLTGQPPCGRATRQSALTRQLYTFPPPVAAHGVCISSLLEDALQSALSKEQEDRPSSVQALYDALTHTLRTTAGSSEEVRNRNA